MSGTLFASVNIITIIHSVFPKDQKRLTTQYIRDKTINTIIINSHVTLFLSLVSFVTNRFKLITECT